MAAAIIGNGLTDLSPKMQKWILNMLHDSVPGGRRGQDLHLQRRGKHFGDGHCTNGHNA
eukprot:CAMPEP_0179316658 /NCGR_PEP_ID=MMETSP0797-20121207/55802_1 /TAXON_ID=47934 /ORGANISM="Dinophysis acuminata, Strain DAEP01" /LENGTH=58 /DNA_ID=CAMNT_0021027443 /DNA_START=47 /DNA_END=223 /DNA_ORIENTATION=+